MRSILAKSAVEWLRAIASRTGAFRVGKVAMISDAAPATSNVPYDLAIELTLTADGQTIQLLVEAQQRVSPLLAIGILKRMRESSATGVPTLCSRAISERVADLCRSQGVNYLDEAGNCRLCAPGFFLQVEGRKPVRAMKQDKVDPFAIKSSRIARVLLGNPKHDWQVQELAGEAQVSLGLVAKVKRELLDQAFVETHDRRIRLRDPKGLLAAWVGSYELSKERVPLYVMQTTGEVERKAARWGSERAIRLALSGLAAAWRLAPFVRYHMSTVYVEPHGDADVVRDLIQHLDGKRVDSGANLLLIVPDDPFLLYQSRNVDGVDVVSPVQLYLDLRKQPGRGEEVAQEILKREIMPTW